MTSHPAFFGLLLGFSHKSAEHRVKCEIFHPLSLGKWISEQAAKHLSPTTAAAVDESLHAALL